MHAEPSSNDFNAYIFFENTLKAYPVGTVLILFFSKPAKKRTLLEKL